MEEMLEEEILEKNKQIALMLGWNYQSLNDRWNEDFRHDYSFLRTDELEFHLEWDWLMMCVEFINKTHNDNNPHRDLVYTINHLLNGGWWGETLIPKRLLSNKEQLFFAVSDFAKYYNEKQR